ncbi:MAG: type II toxin-antitoxin system PemK/MazF family toxin [Candidatus Sulfotelmatobacter sp.]
MWFVHLPTDPPEKGARPVVIVSTDDRNSHPRANTVLVVPLTTSIVKDVPTHVYLAPGETGLEQSVLRAEDIAVVPKSELREPRSRLRVLSNHRVCELVEKIKHAMGC